jgi:hypothetical protein
MKNDPTERLSTKIPLKHIVSQLADSFMPLTQERHSFIVNHVSPRVVLGNDEHLLSLTLGTLLKNVILLSREQCIHIHSTLSGDCTFIQVNCSDQRFYSNLQGKNADLQRAAEKMGGCISMSCDERTGTTIAFSVANSLKIS